MLFFFFSSRRRHTRCSRDWSSDVCSSDLDRRRIPVLAVLHRPAWPGRTAHHPHPAVSPDRKSTRLNSSHGYISYAVFCLKKKKKKYTHSNHNKKKKQKKKKI